METEGGQRDHHQQRGVPGGLGQVGERVQCHRGEHLHLGQGDNGVRNYFCARTMGQQDVPLPFGQSNMHSKLISAQTSQEGIECTQTNMCN